MSDKRRRKTATTATGRLLRLTGMTTSIATRVAGHQVKGLFQSEASKAADREKLMQHIGKEVAATLGEMKGAVMKVGQIASQMQDILPREISEQLAVLQNASAPMPFHVIRRQLEKELGSAINDLFTAFDETPFAAASIGQVHRATTLDGDEVVVKVQYPAVKTSIDSDMKHLRRILKLGSLLKVNEQALDAIFHEIRNQLHEELDYTQEAANLEEFHALHSAQPWLVIPRPYPALSNDKVLTLSLENGMTLEQVNDDNGFDQATRNLIASRLFDVIGQQIFQFRAVHCDPHPGNFAFLPDGTIIMYDFGAVKRLSEDDTTILQRVVQASLAQNWRELDKQLIALGARKPDTDVDDDFYRAWVALLLRAFDAEPFNFGQSQLHTDIMKQVRKTPLEQILKFQPSARSILVERVISGHYWTMMKLGANLAFRPALEKAVNFQAPRT